MLSHLKQHRQLDNQTNTGLIYRKRETKVFTQFFSELSIYFPFHFYFRLFFFWCLQYFSILQYFYIFLLSCAHLLLNKGRDTKVFTHLIYLKFIHHIFPLVLYFTFVSEAFCFVHYLYIFAFQIISPSALTFNNTNTPEEKERYHT